MSELYADADRQLRLPLVAISYSPLPYGLSARQLECLAWVEQGKSAGDIGTILGISRRTVEGHLFRACEQMGVRTRFQAVLILRDRGLIGGVGR